MKSNPQEATLAFMASAYIGSPKSYDIFIRELLIPTANVHHEPWLSTKQRLNLGCKLDWRLNDANLSNYE